MPEQKLNIPKSLRKGGLLTQPEYLSITPKGDALYIGIPCETILQEHRVALVPSSIATLTAKGHRVVVEKGAGIKSNFSDNDFSEAGAEIAYSKEDVFKANILIKAAPPTLEEIDLLHPNQILISPLQVPIINADYINKLRQKRVIALAMEYIKDDIGSFPIVRIMSEIAGLSAILTAAEILGSKGHGVLLGGIAGVPPAKVVILGAGVVAEFATRSAIGLGVEVRVFDNNIYKLMRLQNQVGRQLFTSVLNPFVLENELLNADVVIGAFHSKSGRTPMLVSESMVSKMKAGAVIIDVSIDQGGCFETSEVTSHDKPTFTKHDVIHYCVPNIASKVPRTASIAISNIITPILMKAEMGMIDGFLQSNSGLLHGIYTYKGCLTNQYLGQRFNIKHTDLELLITFNS